jgi:homoprotocatechuate degradation regulator HpaR
LIGIALTPRIRHRNLPQLFLKTRACLMSHFRPILKHFGLTDQQWRILRVLDEHEQLEPREICALCQIQSSSMAGVLARMKDMALIQRQRMPQDQRRVMVQLADRGDQLVREMAPLIDAQYEAIETVFGKKVFDDLFSAMEAFNEVQTLTLPSLVPPSKPDLQPTIYP